MNKSEITAEVVLDSRAKCGRRGSVWVRGSISGDSVSLTLEGDCADFLIQAEKGGLVKVEGLARTATGIDGVKS